MTIPKDRQKISSVLEAALEDAFEVIERETRSKYSPSEIMQILDIEFDVPEYWKQWWLTCDEEWH